MGFIIMTSIKTNKTQLGRSMVEMLGVLAIVGVLSIGGIAGYVKASHQLRTNKLKDDISHLIANIRTVFYTQNNYDSLSVIAAINSGVVPEYMIAEDGIHMVNRKKGSILIGPAATYLNESGAFILIFNGLDSKTCHSLASESWGSDIQTGFLGMTIKKDGDLTVATSKMTDETFLTDDTTFNAKDLPQALITSSYESCNCGSMDICSIAWKFL